MRRERLSIGANEQGVVRADGAASGERASQRLSGLATDRHQSFTTPLSHHPATSLDQVDILDPETRGLAQANAGVEQEQDDGTIAVGSCRALLDRTDELSDIAVAEAWDDPLRDPRDRHPPDRAVGQVEFARDPGTKRANRPDTSRDAARRKRPLVTGLDGEEPAADPHRAKLSKRRDTPVTLEEADELREVVGIPADRARTATGDAERRAVFVDQIDQTQALRPEAGCENFA